VDPREVEVIERVTAFQGYFRVDRYLLRHALFAGGMSRPLSREVFERGQVAAVLPVDVTARRLVLIEQFRPGAFANGWDPWLLECVAGVIEPQESAEDMARREAMEEAGCLVHDLIPMARFLTSPGASTESVTLFCARVDSHGLGGLHGLADEDEDIRVTTWSFQEAFDLVRDGRIVNAKTIIALQWLELNLERVEREWRR
jgi:ADP-ribose pyrophosphatase